MDKTELLAELDIYLALREPEEHFKTIETTAGPINVYRTKGVFTRPDNSADIVHVQFYVYKEGLLGEKAYFEGDPISHFWNLRVEDYIRQWNGAIIRSYRPYALCRIIESAAEGEKYILVTETAPEEYTKEDTTIKEFMF